MRRIIIRHISGSKANQVEEFPADKLKVLTLGRETGQTIRYDPEKDDLVSRQHARIFREEGHDDRFFVSDLNSRNGTYVNKQRISGTASIVPGDVVQLGPGGPEFQFDLDPLPEGILRPTREADRVRETQDAALSASPFSFLAKTSVGRATVERWLGEYQQSSRKTFINLAAALGGMIIIVAGVLLYRSLSIEQKVATTVHTASKAVRAVDEIKENMIKRGSRNDPSMPSAEVAERFGQATVYIEVSWKLIDTKSDKQVYHRYEGGGQYPAFIKVGETYRPWLTIDSDNHTNQAIGGETRGSGFVVTNTGHIMTNRHVAATWHTRYNFPDKPIVVFEVDRNTRKVQYSKGAKPIEGEKLGPIWHQMIVSRPWVPANEKYLVVEGKRKNEYYVVPDSKFEGRFNWLNVTFPKNKLRIPARLARVSDEHDVALIKVDVPENVPVVSMHDSYGESRPGDGITVLGYPGDSPEVKIRTKSLDPLNRSSEYQVVPDLTVSSGLIGRVIRGKDTPNEGNTSDYYSEVGEVFQLAAGAVGAGNSGGPVFDDRGRVIGILTYQNPSMSFAVPIRFGMDIMGVKQALN